MQHMREILIVGGGLLMPLLFDITSYIHTLLFLNFVYLSIRQICVLSVPTPQGLNNLLGLIFYALLISTMVIADGILLVVLAYIPFFNICTSMIRIAVMLSQMAVFIKIIESYDDGVMIPQVDLNIELVAVKYLVTYAAKNSVFCHQLFMKFVLNTLKIINELTAIICKYSVVLFHCVNENLSFSTFSTRRLFQRCTS